MQNPQAQLRFIGNRPLLGNPSCTQSNIPERFRISLHPKPYSKKYTKNEKKHLTNAKEDAILTLFYNYVM